MIVRVERLLRADIERVFSAWSDPETLSRWFVVEPTWTVTATNDFRVGGTFRIEMDRGDGTVFVAWGEYLAIEAPRHLVFTWSSAVPSIQRSRVSIELTALGESTSLVLVHDDLPDTEEGRAHSTGWDGSLASLEHFLVNAIAQPAPT